MTVWSVHVGGFTAEHARLSKEYGLGNLDPSEGIERFRFDDTNGHLEYLDTTSGILSPQYLRKHPTLPALYAAEFSRPGRLTAFGVKPNGGLQYRSSIAALGELTVAVDIHPSGGFAYAANWGSGSVTLFLLDGEGNFLEARPVVPLERRDGLDESTHPAKPHQVRVTPTGNGLLVAYAGLDDLTAYESDDGLLSSGPLVRVEFPPGSAPRHVEFHPSGRFVYVVGERDSRLYVLEADDGIPTRILSSCATPPPGHSGRNNPSELLLHSDGRTLFICNRGSDCIAILDVDDSGGVDTVGHVSSMGLDPRGVSLDPTGRYLLVANRKSGDLVVFAVDGPGLEPVGEPIHSSAPSSITFTEMSDGQEL
jgi:6-phosphogluconolactonase